MNAHLQDDEPFVSEVRRQAERARVAQRLTFWQGLGLVGSIGWMVIIPVLIGAVLGRWIDHLAHTRVFWTLALLIIGLLIGCSSAWRHVGQELHQ
jgi:ATP synthase protein I